VKTVPGKIILLLLIFGIVAGGIYLMRNRPLAVDVAAIEKNVKINVFGLGTVEARILSNIGFKVGNSIIELNVDEGDHVKKGDVLARLDSTEQRARLNMAKTGVLAAKAAVKGAESAILKARTVIGQKKRTYDRKRKLYKKRSVSVESVESAKLELDTARAELEIARSALLTAQASLENARSLVGLEKAVLDQYTLRAPYDAVITARHQELGTVIKIGEPVFTLVDPGSVWILGHVSENQAGAITVGQRAQIRLRSHPHKLYSGTVRRIDIESDRVTEERQVYVTCGECLEHFNLGEQAEVYITTAILDQALLVPQNAVDTFDERQMKGVVWVLESGRLKRRPVTFGHQTLDARLSISDGIAEDADVLARLPKMLKEGRLARVKKETER